MSITLYERAKAESEGTAERTFQRPGDTVPQSHEQSSRGRVFRCTRGTASAGHGLDGCCRRAVRVRLDGDGNRVACFTLQSDQLGLANSVIAVQARAGPPAHTAP